MIVLLLTYWLMIYFLVMIMFLHGADTFRSRLYLRQVTSEFKRQRDPAGYNIVVIDGKKESAGKILTEMNAAPFLAEKRLVVIENILSGSDKELLGELASRVKDNKIPDTSVVIFWQGEALGKVKEVKVLQEVLGKEKYAQEFAPVIGAKLAAWTEKEVTARGGIIGADALGWLAQNIGADMWQLNTLIDQLVAYAKGALITVSHIQLFLEEKLDDNIFNLVDAIVASNRKTAFKLLEHQRALGEEDGKIFGLLIWQFRILLEMADLLEREAHTTSDAMAKTLKLHPFVIKKNMGVARRLPLARLQKIYEDLLAIDIKTKTGAAPQPLLLDVFVGKV